MRTATEILESLDTSGCARNARANAALMLAQAFGNFVREAHAHDRGAISEHPQWPLAPMSERSDGRGRPPAISYVWDFDLTPNEVTRHLRAIATAARLASVTRHDEDACEIATRETVARMTRLFTADMRAYGVWCATDKTHLSGPEAALEDIDGTAWTSSLKGRDASLRSAGFVGANRDEHAYARSADAYVSERDIARA